MYLKGLEISVINTDVAIAVLTRVNIAAEAPGVTVVPVVSVVSVVAGTPVIPRRFHPSPNHLVAVLPMIFIATARAAISVIAVVAIISAIATHLGAPPYPLPSEGLPSVFIGREGIEVIVMLISRH